MGQCREEREVRDLLKTCGAEVERVSGNKAFWLVPTHSPSEAINGFGAPEWRRVAVRRESASGNENTRYWANVLAKVRSVVRAPKSPTVLAEKARFDTAMAEFMGSQKVLSVTQARTVVAPQSAREGIVAQVSTPTEKKTADDKQAPANVLSSISMELVEAASRLEAIGSRTVSESFALSDALAKARRLEDEVSNLKKRLDLKTAEQSRFAGVDVDKLKSENDTLKLKLAEANEKLKGFDALRAALKAVS
jgi:hypothetical protein